MEFHIQSETQVNVQDTLGEHVLSSDTKRHIFLNVFVVVLFASALLGVIQLIMLYDQFQNVSYIYYFSCLGVLVFSMISLSILLVKEARLGERIVQSAEYRSRISLLEKRQSYFNDMLELIADHQSGAVVVFDRHNRFFFVNERAALRMGRPAIEIIDQPPVKILPNDVAKKLELRLAAARTSDEPVIFVDRIADSSGKTHFFQRHYEVVSGIGSMRGCVLLREDDLTTQMVDKERREQTLRQVIETIVAVVDRRDPYATGHSSRVGQLSKAIAEQMELEPHLIEAAEIAGSLMNFGKVLVSRRILTKTSALTPEELQRVRDSILTSADILEIISFDGPVVQTLRQVLERYDGSGVPEHLKGEDILITARIVAAANAFVAFVSPRAHRPGMSFHEALSIMAGDAGKAYDEHVLVAMSRYIDSAPNRLDWLKVGGPTEAAST